MKMKFVDDKRMHIESDIEKIRTKPGMYISYLGERGALHLSKEVIQNAIDECMNPESPGNKISVVLDTDTSTLTVEDNGRGIPEKDITLDILCTKLQSGSKFTRSNNTSTAGENGCGNTAVNALSEWFVWTTYRNHKFHTITYNEGKKVDDLYGSSTSKAYGCILSFKPSSHVLGKNCSIVQEQLVDWLSKTAYFLPDKSSLKFEVLKKGKVIFKETYKLRPLSDMIVNNVKNKPILLEANWTKPEEVHQIETGNEVTIDRDINVSFAFGISPEENVYVDSYCNTIMTPDGGVHLDSVRDAMWKFFMREANDTLSERDKSKFQITKNDVLSSLSLVVSLKTAYQVMFVGQTKNAVSNDLLAPDIRQNTTAVLKNYFSNHKEELASYCKVFKTNAKARVEANKVKNAVVEKVNNIETHNMTKFIPCNNKGKSYKELFICEGKSALGTLSAGRDADNQAFLAFRGVTANAFKRNDVASMLANVEYKDLTKILRCGIGKSFDINKLYYDKIIISTDADIDGRGIASGLCVFFALYMPGVIEHGKLFRLCTPLYHIDNKKKPFVVDKHEYVDTYVDDVLDAYKIKLLDVDDFTKQDYRDFLYETSDYLMVLERVANRFGISMGLAEVVAASVSQSKKNNHCKQYEDVLHHKNFYTTLLSEVQNKYPEMELSKDSTNLRGVVDGSYQSLDINHRFVNTAEDLFEIYDKYGYLLKVKDKTSGDYNKMTIMDFLNMSSKYKPTILTRYKGLGEMDASEIWETSLNPNYRKLRRLTFDDVKADLAILKKLHGTGKHDLEARKDMMNNFKINREDLDN